MALNELMKASGNTLLTTAVMTGIGLVTSVLTARILGPEGRGLFSAALLIAMLAAGLAQFGLGNSLVYHRGAGRSFNYRNLLLGSLLFVIAVAVGLAGVGLQLGGEDRLRGQFMLILGLAAAMAAQNYFITLAQLHPGLVFFNLMRLGLVAGNLVLLLVLIAAFHPVDYRKILIAQLIVLAVLAVAGQVWATRELAAGVRVGGVPLKWREVFRYGIAHHGTSVLGLVLLNFDKIALLKMGTMVQFGLYALAFSTSRLIGAVQEAISTALYSRFAGKDPGQLSQGVRAAFRVTLLPMLAVATACAALSPWLIVLLFGSAFAPMTHSKSCAVLDPALRVRHRRGQLDSGAAVQCRRPAGPGIRAPAGFRIADFRGLAIPAGAKHPHMVEHPHADGGEPSAGCHPCALSVGAQGAGSRPVAGNRRFAPVA
jgi:antigen flippase